MSRTGVVVARIAGVDLRVRPSALVLPGAITWLLATQLLPAADPGIGLVLASLLGLTGAFLFELGVVLHEVGHAVTARRAGLRADVAELQLFGGITEITGTVRCPRDQLRIAATGPAVSLGYAAAVGVLTLLVSVAGGPATIVALGVYVATASGAIGAVNLLPGAPLDGGRLLQAWFWQRYGDRNRAGCVAARAGQWIAALLVVAGIALAASGVLGLLGGASVAAMGGTAWLGAREERRELTERNRPHPEAAEPQAAERR